MVSARERNRQRARYWLAFMQAGGQKWPGGSMLRHHWSRYFQQVGNTVYLYIAVMP